MMHYTHSRRAFIQGSVGALALSALAACSSGDSKGSGSSKPAAKEGDFTGEGPISWVQGKDLSGGMVQKRLDEWNAKYPKEKVSLIELSSEADQQRQSLINAAQTNSAAYDVIGLDLVWVAEFAANRWIVEIPSDTKPVGVIDSVWETGSYRGKQYAVPYTTDAPIMYYRKDFLEQAKVEIPKTWEDVKKATEAVRKLPGMQNIGGFGGQWAKYEGLTCNIAEFINTCGGAIVDDSGKVTVDSPESIKGIQTAVDAFKSKLIPAAALEWKEEDSRAMASSLAKSSSYVTGLTNTATILRNSAPTSSVLPRCRPLMARPTRRPWAATTALSPLTARTRPQPLSLSSGGPARSLSSTTSRSSPTPPSTASCTPRTRTSRSSRICQL